MAQKPKRGAGMPLPPAPPEGGPDDQDYVYMSPGEQQAVQPYYGLPLMTPEMRRYRVGGRQMMDPHNFEYIQRKREEARTQGTRLKKGGPVKKYQKGGAVEDGKDKYPSERRMLKKELARTRQRRADMDTELDPTGDREAVMSAPFQVQRPSAFYPLTGRDYVGPRQQMDRERARREAEVQRRVDVARRSLDDRMSTMESSLSEMGTKENKQNYRKGGAIKKAGGGMVEIEIKVGGGGKRKGMHMMPDGSMMKNKDHAAMKKGGKAKMYREGGPVDIEFGPESSKAVTPRRLQRREYDGPSRRSNRSLIEQTAEAARRNPVLGPIARGAGALRRATLPKKAEELERRSRRGAPSDIESGPQDPFTLPPGLYINPNQEEEIVNIKKGGMVKAKAPAKKMAHGGKVAAPKKMMMGGMTSKPKKMMGGGRAMYAKGGMAKGKYK